MQQLTNRVFQTAARVAGPAIRFVLTTQAQVFEEVLESVGDAAIAECIVRGTKCRTEPGQWRG